MENITVENLIEEIRIHTESMLTNANHGMIKREDIVAFRKHQVTSIRIQQLEGMMQLVDLLSKTNVQLPYIVLGFIQAETIRLMKLKKEFQEIYNAR